MHDQLASLQARTAILLTSSRAQDSRGHASLVEHAIRVEQDLQIWAENASKAIQPELRHDNGHSLLLTSTGSHESFIHESADRRLWVSWHACRVMITMRRETITQGLQCPHPLVPYEARTFSILRRETIAGICSTVFACADTPLDQRNGSIAHELSMIMPLWTAGICILRELQSPETWSSDGSGRTHFLEKPQDTETLYQQFGLVLGRLKHAAISLGDRHAAELYAQLSQS